MVRGEIVDDAGDPVEQAIERHARILERVSYYRTDAGFRIASTPSMPERSKSGSIAVGAPWKWMTTSKECDTDLHPFGM